MSNTEETKFYELDERIERFLRGEMSTEEETSFREELKSDSELRDHARAVRRRGSSTIKKFSKRSLLKSLAITFVD